MRLVSVVIPARGRSRLVSRAIASVRRQTVPTEIILVDDGSVPPLASELDSATLEGVSLLVNSQNYNAAYSRNRGVEAASGPVVAFLDSDDEWLPDHLESALEVCRFDEQVVHVTPLKESAEDLIADPYDYLFNLEGDFRSSGIVCGRNTFESIDGFDSLLEKHQDWDFILRASRISRLKLGSKPTVRLGLTGRDRMSANPNIQASQHFLMRHNKFMSHSHLVTFFAGVIRSCVAAGDFASLRLCQSWMIDWVKEEDLDMFTRSFSRWPKLGRLLLNSREWFR